MGKRVLTTSGFQKSAGQRFNQEELETLLAWVQSNPGDGEELHGLEGVRSLLWPSSSSGASVWHRIVYLHLEQYQLIYLLEVLDADEEAFPTASDRLDAIETLGRISELALRIAEILIRLTGS